MLYFKLCHCCGVVSSFDPILKLSAQVMHRLYNVSRDRSIFVRSKSGVNSMGFSGRLTSGKIDFSKLQQGLGGHLVFDDSNLL